MSTATKKEASSSVAITELTNPSMSSSTKSNTVGSSSTYAGIIDAAKIDQLIDSYKTEQDIFKPHREIPKAISSVTFDTDEKDLESNDEIVIDDYTQRSPSVEPQITNINDDSITTTTIPNEKTVPMRVSGVKPRRLTATVTVTSAPASSAHATETAATITTVATTSTTTFPIVKAVLLKTDGSIKQVDLDTDPNRQHIVKLLSDATPKVIGHYKLANLSSRVRRMFADNLRDSAHYFGNEELVIVRGKHELKYKDAKVEPNPHKLPYPFDSLLIRGDILVYRVNKHSQKRFHLTDKHWRCFVNEVDRQQRMASAAKQSRISRQKQQRMTMYSPISSSVSSGVSKTRREPSLISMFKQSEQQQPSSVVAHPSTVDADTAAALLTVPGVEEQIKAEVRRQLVVKTGREPSQEEMDRYTSTVMLDFFGKVNDSCLGGYSVKARPTSSRRKIATTTTTNDDDASAALSTAVEEEPTANGRNGLSVSTFMTAFNLIKDKYYDLRHIDPSNASFVESIHSNTNEDCKDESATVVGSTATAINGDEEEFDYTFPPVARKKLSPARAKRSLLPKSTIMSSKTDSDIDEQEIDNENDLVLEVVSVEQRRNDIAEFFDRFRKCPALNGREFANCVVDSCQRVNGGLVGGTGRSNLEVVTEVLNDICVRFKSHSQAKATLLRDDGERYPKFLSLVDFSVSLNDDTNPTTEETNDDKENPNNTFSSSSGLFSADKMDSKVDGSVVEPCSGMVSSSYFPSCSSTKKKSSDLAAEIRDLMQSSETVNGVRPFQPNNKPVVFYSPLMDASPVSGVGSTAIASSAAQSFERTHGRKPTDEEMSRISKFVDVSAVPVLSFDTDTDDNNDEPATELDMELID